MRNRWPWLMAFGLALLLATMPLSRGLAGEAEKKAEAPPATKEGSAAAEKSAPAEKPSGLVGTVVAVVPESRTLVVDVPLGKEVLLIGAVVTKETKIDVAGKAVPLERLKRGARVRIDFRRIPTGDKAISVEVLRGPKG